MLSNIVVAPPTAVPLTRAAPTRDVSLAVTTGAVALPQPDAATLTLTGRVRQLRQEGDQTLQISEKLDLSTAEVANDFVITTTFPQLPAAFVA